MPIPAEIVQKLKNLQIVSNKTRFLILTSLYSSNVLGYSKHSQTFTELMNVIDISNSDLAYHLDLLIKSNLITKKLYPEENENSTYYHISDEGERVLKVIGVNEKLIKTIKKEMA